MPAACHPRRLAASTLLVATNPAMAALRATAMAAATPWLRRNEKSTRSTPRAARRHRAAFDVTAVWKVTWFRR